MSNISKGAKGKPLTVKQIARMIERRVSYFNGWSVPEETMRQNCQEAAIAILRAVYRRPHGKG